MAFSLALLGMWHNGLFVQMKTQQQPYQLNIHISHDQSTTPVNMFILT